ncbi:MAG TPA: SLC13 family permease [Pyrinomonadaceae bacterium]|jgi:anion transporter
MSNLVEIISAVPLFSALSREDAAKVVGKMEPSSFQSGATILSQGDEGDAFYLIESGAVEVVRHSVGRKSEVLAVLGEREWFGEMALLSGEARSATIIAVKDTLAWRLSRDSWQELIDKHPTWLLHFCATLSKRLSRLDQEFSHGRDAFESLAEEFYAEQNSAAQRLFRQVSLLHTISLGQIAALYGAEEAKSLLSTLEDCRPPLCRQVEAGYELHHFFRDFLRQKLLDHEGAEQALAIHKKLGTHYESTASWVQAIDHYLEANEWECVSRLVLSCKNELLDEDGVSLGNALARLPPDYLLSNLSLVHLKADCEARSGDLMASLQTYRDALSRTGPSIAASEAVARYRNMADALAHRRDLSQAVHCLQNALKLIELEAGSPPATLGSNQRIVEAPATYRVSLGVSRLWISFREGLIHWAAVYAQTSSIKRSSGAVLGIAVWAYLWFAKPDIGLQPIALKQLAFLSLALVFWVFWVLPEHGVALIFALGLILYNLESPDLVLSGFSSSTWFMSLGVLGLGAAITGSGLFYRMSLQLVRCFPLTFFWQNIALGVMGVTVAALIPQKSARATVISQMLVNLSESLGYKTPSKASTGFFAASFLGLGQLNFLFLTGSTATLLAWGLLPTGVRATFTWGRWFLAAFPPALVTIIIVLTSTYFLYRPETESAISYKMIRSQLEILGPLSAHEWITVGVLCITVIGWLTFSYHHIQGAWVALIALCTLINTGVLGWSAFKKSIDWEFLIYLGATQSLPELLAKAKIDTWLSSSFLPLVLPFIKTPVITFILIALIGFALKLVFSQRLTVLTLVIALVPLAARLNVNPWVVTMVVLIGSEPWFFRYQIDWHTLAHATTEGKGFSYPLMCRVNPFFALAYLASIVAAVPYWRYLGLIK